MRGLVGDGFSKHDSVELVDKSSSKDEETSMKRSLAAITAIAMLLALINRSSLASASELSSGGTETGVAACYSRRLAGHRTASGRRYNPHAFTAAHPTIPLGTRVKLTNLKNGRSTVVTANDRLSAHAGNIMIDISKRACRNLKFPRGGEAKVRLEVLPQRT
jgi:rare lipoprotein A